MRAQTACLAVVAADRSPHRRLRLRSPPHQRRSAFEIAQLKAAPRAPTAASVGEGQTVAKINNWTVGLASGLPEGTFIRFGAEIARNLNDGDELRVIPMITYGATDNVKDLLYLKGVDVAFTNADVLEHFRTVEKIPNIERRVNFISGMYIGHVHVLVRADINSLQGPRRQEGELPHARRGSVGDRARSCSSGSASRSSRSTSTMRSRSSK